MVCVVFLLLRSTTGQNAAINGSGARRRCFDGGLHGSCRLDLCAGLEPRRRQVWSLVSLDEGVLAREGDSKRVYSMQRL